MNKIINVYKPIGLTPLQVVNEFKEKYPEYKNKKIGYAGRLDPMAHGVLILLVEPETKKRSKYQNLDKEYEFELLLGIETDTFDILGIPKTIRPRTRTAPLRSSHNNMERELRKIISSLIGKRKHAYPPYSSKTVGGKPLYWWARKGKLRGIKLPKKEINIYSLKLVKTSEIDKNVLSKTIVQRINKVSGKFRQKKILNSWKNYFRLHDDISTYHTYTLRVHCSSGTYIRSICHEIGIKLGTGAVATNILRSRTGSFRLKNSLQLT